MKIKVACFLENITKEILFNYLDNGKIDLYIVVDEKPTVDNMRLIPLRFREYKTLVKGYYFNSSLPENKDFDCVIFSSSDYERARVYADIFSWRKVFLLEGNWSEEHEHNFSVANWQYIDEWVKSKYREINAKSKAANSSGTAERDSSKSTSE